MVTLSRSWSLKTVTFVRELMKPCMEPTNSSNIPMHKPSKAWSRFTITKLRFATIIQHVMQHLQLTLFQKVFMTHSWSQCTNICHFCTVTLTCVKKSWGLTSLRCMMSIHHFLRLKLLLLMKNPSKKQKKSWLSLAKSIVKGFMQPLRNVGLMFTLTKGNAQAPTQVVPMIPTLLCF